MNSRGNFCFCFGKTSIQNEDEIDSVVGERPIVNIYLDNVGINGLWDTGSMVSVMNENFLQKNFPEVEIRSVEEVLGINNVMITIANQEELNVIGIAIMNFGVEKEQSLFQIPFLVIPDTTTQMP